MKSELLHSHCCGNYPANLSLLPDWETELRTLQHIRQALYHRGISPTSQTFLQCEAKYTDQCYRETKLPF